MGARTSFRCGLALLAALFAGALPTEAQQRSCFAQTGHCIGGRFVEFWQQNGGLPVFGYPLTDELTEQGRTVQYFERQRFELHSENAPPYDVLLGLLGEEVLRQQGIDWHTQPTSPGSAASCLWFQQTINGEMFQVQWFERARFEWHPGNADPYRVLLGRLGAEVQPAPAPTPSTPLYASQDSPAEVLASFYNAINRQEYGRAYGYWETPPSPYDQFAQGYADTASVQLIVQLPAFIGVGAGNAYSNIATVLIATRREGSQQTFVGCYTTHKVNIQPDVWHLARATIAAAAASLDIPSALAQACAM